MHFEHKQRSSGWLTVLLLVLLVGGIVFSGWKIYGILSEYHAAMSEYSEASNTFTVERDEEEIRQARQAHTAITFDRAETGEDDVLPDFQSVDLAWRYTVDYAGMWQVNGDVVGWIESPGTVIDYPVLHGSTNDTYLYAMWTGRWNSSGSIFVDSLCKGDLSDYNTVFYGHNMKNGAMFHSLKEYAAQSYYEEHPYLWYSTPAANYVLYVVAGYVVDAYDSAYDLIYSAEDVRSFVASARAYSDFTADYVVDGMDADYIAQTANRVVVLSTCSYEFTDARYIVVAVPLLAY